MFEDELWRQLERVTPGRVVINTRVEYKDREFLISVFNEKFIVNVAQKTILPSPKTYPYLPLFLLHYLVCAKDLPLSGKLVTPEELRGGLFFFRGAHELPLNKLVGKFGGDIAGFIEKGKKLGGEIVNYGDAAVKLWLLPRIPIIFVLWKKDEEFESRVNILLDKTAEEQMNLDILFLGLLYVINRMGED